MRLKFEASFLRDVKNIPEKFIREKVEAVIEEVEKAGDLSSIKNIKKLKGGKIYYRIRLGEFRIGFRFTEGTVIFDRILNRKEMNY